MPLVYVQVFACNLQHVKNPNYVLILHLLATVFGQFLAQVSQFEKRLHFWSKLIIKQDGRHPTLDKHTVKYVPDMVTSWWQTLINVSYILRSKIHCGLFNSLS